MFNRRDNQDVGLEAAIIKRVRNSSLVKRFCADNFRDYKIITEAWDAHFECVMVGERSVS